MEWAVSTGRTYLGWLLLPGNPEASWRERSPPRGQGRRQHVILVIAAAVLVAVAVRLAAQLQSGFLTGLWQYDDAVYLGAAVRIVDGARLYHGASVLMGPPGGPLLLTPLAELARVVGTQTALVVARLAMPLVAGANVVLLGLLLRHRAPLVAAVACFTLALYPDGILTTLTVMLEPPLEFFCLLGAVILFDGDALAGSRRRVLLAGVALGVAGAVKAWAVLPAVVIAALCLPRVRQRLIPFGAGVAGGFLTPCGPFLIPAPMAFMQQVVLAQLGRRGPIRASAVVRLEFLSGLWAGIRTGAQTDHLLLLTGAVCAAIPVAVWVVFALTRRPVDAGGGAGSGAPGPRTSPLERFALAASVVILAGLLWPSEFWYHYAAFFGPFLALVLGLTAGRAAAARPLTVLTITAVVLAAAVYHAAAIPGSLPTLRSPAAEIAVVD
ncbi:MAG TPA: hypothetical protein VMW49_05940, partial [Candidatus Dormibacteraeota bacterium]|nr:hypothetical protein [Candidatus Dormibacteraeota bacterium]